MKKNIAEQHVLLRFYIVYFLILCLTWSNLGQTLIIFKAGLTWPGWPNPVSTLY